MSGIIILIALIGAAFILNFLIGSMGQGIINLFQKIGFGKVASYVFGGCLFLVILAIMKYLIDSSGIFA